jgi:hypothetical protein
MWKGFQVLRERERERERDAKIFETEKVRMTDR